MVKWAHRTVFYSWPRKYWFFQKNCFTWKYLASNFICDKRGSINFCCKIKMPLQKNANVNAPKFFFPLFSGRILLSLKKIVIWKNIWNLISHKKGYIHFRCQTPPSLQEVLGPQKRFFTVFSEDAAFFEKRLNSKIFSTQFVIKKAVC